GVVGLDVLREQEPDVYEPLDLGVGRCRMVIAQSIDLPPQLHGAHLRVATKYPRLTDEFYLRRGVQADIIKLYGSIELAAVIGLADQIVDLVSTGETLRQNRLRVVDELLAVSSRLIVNRAALKLRWERMQQVIARLRHAVEALESEPPKSDRSRTPPRASSAGSATIGEDDA
ncbi:MAG: ATP phosphoribosyltransferase, partial [Myxococcales bacterium]|nr:ATP phosphoribosyltransferase [Myxococcales bacterium]